MVEDNNNNNSKTATTSSSSVTDEEARLRDRLQGKKVEHQLRERLLAKKERRQSESDGSENQTSKAPDESSNKNSSSNNKNNNNKGSPTASDNNSNSSSSSRSRSSGRNSTTNSNDNNNNKDKNGSNGSKNHSPKHDRDRDRDRGGRHREHKDRRSTSRERHHGLAGGRNGRWGGGGGRGGAADWPSRGGGGGGGPAYGTDPFGRAFPPGHFHGPRGPPDRYARGPPPPHLHSHRHGRAPYMDDHGRGPPPRHVQNGRSSRSRSRSIASRSYSSRSRSRSRSPSRSLSRSPSRSRSRSVSDKEDEKVRRSNNSNSSSNNKRGRSPDRGGGGWNRKNPRRGPSSRHSRSPPPSSSGSSISSSSSSSSSEEEVEEAKIAVDTFTKDQRTVFVNQLVMRTTSKDIRRYFRRKVGAKVNEVILLKDRRTGKHKGCAYVEMKSMEDVAKALAVSGQPPDFQRFPILVKASEAEKNYLVPASASVVTANQMGTAVNSTPLIGPDGRPMEAQKVYVGNLDPSITEEHLFHLFREFGDLYKVSLQKDPASGISKGYAFLSFRDPKEAHLSIATMANQVLAGRGMKTGWATLATAAPGVKVVTSDEFPPDAGARAHRAQIALTQLSLGAAFVSTAPSTMMMDPSINAAVGQVMAGSLLPSSSLLSAASVSKVPTVAEARQSLAQSAVHAMITTTTSAAVVTLESPDAKIIGRADNPSRFLLIRNMFDKDEETEPGWADEIAEEFKDECTKFGKIEHVMVMKNDPGGKIYASFDNVEAAKLCASSLAGRWFDKRQLRVEYVNQEDIPKEP